MTPAWSRRTPWKTLATRLLTLTDACGNCRPRIPDKLDVGPAADTTTCACKASLAWHIPWAVGRERSKAESRRTHEDGPLWAAAGNPTHGSSPYVNEPPAGDSDEPGRVGQNDNDNDYHGK